MFDTEFLRGIFRMTVATIFMAIITYVSVRSLNLMATDNSFFATFPKFAIIVLISFAAYVVFSRLMKIPETEVLIKQLEKLALWQPKGKN